MLAVLSDRRVFDDTWVFERKLDGIRALTVRAPRVRGCCRARAAP